MDDITPFALFKMANSQRLVVMKKQSIVIAGEIHVEF
jgi:hypothetical protein